MMDSATEDFIRALTEFQKRVEEGKKYVQALPMTSVCILEAQMLVLRGAISDFKGAIYARTAAAQRANKPEPGMGDVPSGNA